MLRYYSNSGRKKGSYLLFYVFMAFITLVFFPKTMTYSQKIVYRLHMGKGMPDNHVYGCITDRLGYLWLTTPKGIVKYNGYSFKTFGINEGLPTEDNWRLIEDNYGVAGK